MFWRFLLLGLIFVGNLWQEVLGANILILEGLASPSHHVFIRVINEALAAQGHNVTSIGADVEAKPVANLTYLHNDKVYEHLYSGSEDWNIMDFSSAGTIGTIKSVEEYHLNMLDGIRKSAGYHQLLAYPDDFHFDLVIYDFMAMPVLLGFQHKFHNPPLIGISPSFGLGFTINVVGSSFYPSYIPFYFGIDYQENFCGKVKNFFFYFYEYFHRKYVALPKIYSIIKDDFPGLPALDELELQTLLALVNYSPAVHDPEPMLPNVVPIGGLHIKQAKNLPEEYLKILNSASKGLILFSMGTNIKSRMLGEERIGKIIEAFKKLPQFIFLWKFEDENIPNLPENVLVRKWMPQNDILAHPNTKLFMSHCGLMSTLESSWHGVPILALPVLLDQFTNANQLVKTGVAERINLNSFTSDELQKVILKMMSDTKYQENAKTRSRLFQDQPQTPLERALWWINFVLRNPDVEFLQSKSRFLDVLTLHSVDVIAFYVILVLIAVFILKKITSFLSIDYRFFCLVFFSSLIFINLLWLLLQLIIFIPKDIVNLFFNFSILLRLTIFLLGIFIRLLAILHNFLHGPNFRDFFLL
uniref:Putative udp-glucoronosyl and udp-glucosyl transferase n=1 Tax=Lutzomyia longipalpis TaxID=7200 RepID=A0A7G3B2B4_LUTLO